VHEKVQDEFSKKLTAKMGWRARWQRPRRRRGSGRWSTPKAATRWIELVDDALSKGREVLTGGKAPGGTGYFYPATVLSNVPDNAKMLNEEIIGPVASLQTFTGRVRCDQARQRHEYGLVAYLYTKDLGRGLRVSEKLDFGMIGSTADSSPIQRRRSAA
jgi:succinate-semialdehyde dehydrogenase/glutarate-semialdehyde dehydrogenase